MKKHLQAHLFFIGTFILFTSFVTVEIYLRKIHGIPQLESNPPQFKYCYVDIYKNLFKKFYKEGKLFYKLAPEKVDFGHFPLEFPAIKDKDTLRFFILGGSVAESFHDFSLFESLFPDKRLEIINCGMGAYDSYRAYLVAREIISYRPDLVIVISGNNEFYEKYKINLLAYFINRFFRKFWVYRKLQNYVGNQRSEYVSTFDVDRQNHLRIYEKNIRAIACLMNSKKIPLIICTVPSNFKDNPPAGDHPLDRGFLFSRLLLDRGNYEDAISGFGEFLKKLPRNNHALYFLGKAYEGTRNYEKAKGFYLFVRDLDFVGVGAGTTSNEVIRRVCRQEDIVLADLEKIFMNVSAYGLCGRNLFYDYCHPHQSAYCLFSAGIIQEILEDEKLCSDLLGKKRHFPEVLSLLNGQHDFLHHPGNDDQRLQYAAVWRTFDSEIERIKNPASHYSLNEQAISLLEILYLRSAADFWELQFSKEKIIDAFSREPWTKEFFVKYLPYSERLWATVLTYMGEIYRRFDEYDKALHLFNEAISAYNAYYYPYLGKAMIYYALGEHREVEVSFIQAEKLADSPQKQQVIKYYKEFLGL